MAPRKVVGTVDTSEFVVAVCASLGFLLALDRSIIAVPVVVALLLGGIVAAPIAAWLVRWLHPRVLGSVIGGVIVLTNGRTLMNGFGIAADAQMLIYAALIGVWAVALYIAFRAIRSERLQVAAATPAFGD